MIHDTLQVHNPMIVGDDSLVTPAGRPEAAPANAPTRLTPPGAPVRMESDAFVSSAPAEPGPTLLEKAGTKVVGAGGKVVDKAADKYFFKDHGYQPPEALNASFGGLGLDLRVRPIKSDDDLIKADPYRQRTTDRFKKAGSGVTWAELRGAVTPRLGYSAWTPVGPINASIGFSAEASLGVSILAPYRHQMGEQVPDLSVKLPFGHETARALNEGTEITMRGRGRVAVSAGARVGDSWVPIRGPWSIGTSLGSDAYVSTDHELSLRIKRLDGERVFVSIAKVDTDAAGFSATARAGVHSSTSQLADEYAPNGGKAGELVARNVSRQVEKWLSAEARTVYTASESERRLKNYVFDLSRPEARQAYDALLKLDTRPADELAGRGPNSGAAAVWLDESGEGSQQELRLGLGPIDLLKSTTRSDFADGKLLTRDGPIRYDRTTLDHQRQDIITRWWLGRRETQREISATHLEGSASKLQLKLRNEVKVDITTPSSQVRRFLTLAQYAGVTSPDPAALARDEKFLASFGRSNRKIDFALNNRGLERLLTASDDELKAAFAAGYEELDRPWDVPRLFGWEKDKTWRVTPWLNTAHPEHREVIRLLEAGPNSPGSNSSQQSNEQNYYFITGRPLWKDAEAYQESKRLVGLIGKLRQAPTTPERSKILQAERGDLGVDCMREFAMLAKIAGRDGLTVAELWIEDKGRNKKLAFAVDGPVQDPRQIIDLWLAQPDTGQPPALPKA